MSNKRKDKKNRILRNGESQRSDGRYAYVYVDESGKQRFLYSWKLESRDIVPAGKRDCTSLREKVKRLNENRRNTNFSMESSMTVVDLVEKYIGQKTGVRHNTDANYRFVLNIIRKETFGLQLVKDIRISEAKIWLIKLQKDGRGYSTIHAIRGVIRPAFQMAMDDDIISKNPFDFQLATVVVNDSVTRESISKKQEHAFLEFIKSDRHFCRYYDAIYILFKTGLRISEFSGLTLTDIDLKERRINVDHQLHRKRNMEYVIQETKTSSGTRSIPMTEDVYSCFQRIIETRIAPKTEPMIDGKSGFLFLDKNNMPMVALHWEKYFQHIREKYNSIYKVQLPQITPHVCRHTYCSNMAKAGINPKALQYLMGHSEIGVTLNTYTHIKYEDAKNELHKFANGN